MYQELVAYIVKGLVDHPDQVVVSELRDGPLVTLALTVGPEDGGRVIGRNGRVINAVRTVVQAVATPKGERIAIEVTSP
jgi:predicted RNA-binding protein YlqC (UPF0109 family)